MLQSTPLGDDSHWYVSIVVDSIVICNKPSSHTIISCSGWVSIEIGALIVTSSLMGIVYPSIPLVTVPITSSVMTGSLPRIPSLFSSV